MDVAKVSLIVLTALLLCTGCEHSCNGPGNTGWWPNSSAARPLVTLDGQLYILASGPGDELTYWVYSGAGEPQRVRVLDSAGVDPSVNHEDAVVFDGALIFSAHDNTHGRELWRLEDSKLALVADLNPGVSGSISWNSGLTVVSNTVYFSAYHPDMGTELWSYDGHNPPTVVSDILPGADGSNPGYLAAFGDIVVFRATTASGSNIIWQYDGVSPPGIVSELSNFHSAVTFNDDLYFNATTLDRKDGLWRWDGSSAPELIFDVRPTKKVSVHGRLYFSTSFPDKLWSYDGRNPPSQVFAEQTDDFTTIDIMTAFKNKLLYERDGVLWAFDGSVHSQVEPTNYAWYARSGSYEEFDDKIYFSGWDDVHGQELWVYDNENVKAGFVADIFPGKFCSVDDGD